MSLLNCVGITTVRNSDKKNVYNIGHWTENPRSQIFMPRWFLLFPMSSKNIFKDVETNKFSCSGSEMNFWNDAKKDKHGKWRRRSTWDGASRCYSSFGWDWVCRIKPGLPQAPKNWALKSSSFKNGPGKALGTWIQPVSSWYWARNT